MITITAAQSAHIPEIARLSAECFSDPWQEDRIARQLDRFIVARDDGGAVVGYLVLSHVLDEGDLDSLAVSLAHRRRGIGEALTEACIARAKELSLSFVTLEVRAGNAPAIALYEKKGFAPVGCRKNYYEKPREDAILMTLVMK